MRTLWKAIAIIGLGLSPPAALAAVGAWAGRPVILFNPSPSEPTGLYRLSADPPSPGKIIAFKVPDAGRSYAAAHLGSIAMTAILKQVAAVEGAVVCARENHVQIGGKERARAAVTDNEGAPLPHWSGCHRLRSGQYFVLSNRIPNSFDSRYYGPVSQADLIGVYRPLWTQP